MNFEPNGNINYSRSKGTRNEFGANAQLDLYYGHGDTDHQSEPCLIQIRWDNQYKKAYEDKFKLKINSDLSTIATTVLLLKYDNIYNGDIINTENIKTSQQFNDFKYIYTFDKNNMLSSIEYAKNDTSDGPLSDNQILIDRFMQIPCGQFIAPAGFASGVIFDDSAAPTGQALRYWQYV